MKATILGLSGATAISFALAALAGDHGQPAPLDAVATILDAFRGHDVVALDEPHGDERAYAFRTALVRDPRFAAVVNDILVESGNSRYQAVMDRFAGGERVPDAELKRVWQDTTMAGAIWDRPVYEEFFRTVRAVNDTLPSSRRLRVLLGDPPIDWETIRTPEDLQRVHRAPAGRSAHPAEILVRETVRKQRRALVVYGGLHLIRQNGAGPNLVEHAERAGARAFVLLTHPGASLDALGVDHASWPVPAIALTRGSSLANQADAVLYLGRASGRTVSRLSASLCADARYREMRVRRMTLAGAPDPAAQLEKECWRE
jgi:hypothetical protein